MTTNLQEDNVGNLGDILKHAALLQLIRFFNGLAGRKAYLDTHCYLLQGRLVNPNWSAEVHGLLQAYPLYHDYLRVQQPYIERGAYLCSSGIVSQQSDDIELMLSESNPDTRDVLQKQLHTGDIRASIKDDMALWHGHLNIKDGENIFILLDPFRLNERLWRDACLLLEQGMAATAHGLLLVFHYDKADGPFAWPRAAVGWDGPVASLSQAPYHLAVYGTPALGQTAARLLVALGWQSLLP